MASVVNRPNGLREIQFTDADGKRFAAIIEDADSQNPGLGRWRLTWRRYSENPTPTRYP